MNEEIINLYDCDVCGFRYDPARFANVDFDAQPRDFECPDCQAGKDHFHLFKPPSDDVAPVPAGESDQLEELDPSGPRTMYTHSSSPTLGSLHLQYSKGRLDTQPDFQRYEVWSPQKKSKLIESILLDLPIPQVFLAEEPDGTSVVIDGQQRLMAIFRYLQDEYALKDVPLVIVDFRTFSFQVVPAE